MLLFTVVCTVNSCLLSVALWCFLPLRGGFNRSSVAYHIPQRSGFTEHWLKGSGGNSQRKMKDGALRRLCSVSSFLCHNQNSARLFVLKHIILINRGNHTTQGIPPPRWCTKQIQLWNNAEKSCRCSWFRVNLVKYSLVKIGSLWVHECLTVLAY